MPQTRGDTKIRADGEPGAGSEPCADCAADLVHCHGVAITHRDGWGECTDDPDCTLAVEWHWFMASCDLVSCRC